MRKTKTTLVILAAMLLCGILLLNAAAADGTEGKDYSVRILERIPNEISRETAHDSAWYREDAVYARMMALKSSYPEGMPWTNDNTYSRTYLWYGGSWDGMRITYTGMGCVGFALIMSDAGFGSDMPIYQKYGVPFSEIRVGDILRINNDTHSVIVTQVNSSSVTLAEGNYNSSIHWGRTMSASEVEAANYVLTRWPGVPQFTSTVSYDANGGTGAPEAQTVSTGDSLKLRTAKPSRKGCFFLGWAEDAGAAAAVYQPGETVTVEEDMTLYAVWAVPDLVLPSSVTAVTEESFRGDAFRFAKLPEGAKSIGKNAFASCTKLKYVYIPATVTSIDSTAFSGVSGLTVFGKSGSAAEDYALDQGYTFKAVP